jgi:hypothetical protein
MSGVTFDPTNTTSRQASWDGTRAVLKLVPRTSTQPLDEVNACSTLPEEHSVNAELRAMQARTKAAAKLEVQTFSSSPKSVRSQNARPPQNLQPPQSPLFP